MPPCILSQLSLPWGPVFLVVFAVLGCDGPAPPRPKADPVVADPVVAAEPEPLRAPIVRTVRPHPWGAEVEACGEPCTRARLRPQSSSEATVAGPPGPAGEAVPQRILLADLAADGDPATAWCATDGVGQRLSLALPEPWDVRRLHLGLANVDPTGDEGFESWTEAKLTTDARDNLTVQLDPLDQPGASSPVLDVSLQNVQFLQLEALALSGDHSACVREVVVEGEPASVP